MFRQESCHASTVTLSEERTRRDETRSEPSWTPGGPPRGRRGRQEARPEAVLAARRPVRRPSWRQGGPCRAVLDSRRPVRMPSWTPGGPSGGRLGRQEARLQALLQFCCKMLVLRSWQQGAVACNVATALSPTGQFLYRYLYYLLQATPRERNTLGFSRVCRFLWFSGGFV